MRSSWRRRTGPINPEALARSAVVGSAKIWKEFFSIPVMIRSAIFSAVIG